MMTWDYIMGLVASIALFLPITLLFTFRLAGYRTFPALLIYYVLLVADNMFSQGSIKVGPEITKYFSLGNNLLDAPLMLFFLTYFCNSPAFAKKIKIYILLFMVFEVITVLLIGFKARSIIIVMAPALLSVLVFSFYFFIRQTKLAIMYRKAVGKALIASSMLFAYGCYSIIYLMFYVFKNPDKAGTFVIYFLVTTFAALLMSVGIIIEKTRVQKLEELKRTRKELSIVYNSTKPAVTLRAIRPEKENYN